MTKEQRDELRRLAKAATPGPWELSGYETLRESGHDVHSDGDAVPLGTVYHNTLDTARYIAAANPAAILGLLDEIERLRAALEDAIAELEDQHVDLTWPVQRLRAVLDEKE